MPKHQTNVRLSPMSGGINGYEREAKKHQALEALNVLEDKGDLRRRDAFRSVYMSQPFMLPAGLVTVKTYDYGTDTFTDHSTRSLNGLNYADLSSTKRILIGCEEQFHGIDFRVLEASSGSYSGDEPQIWSRPRYVLSWSPGDGIDDHETDFAMMPWLIDTTQAIFDQDNFHTLCRSGYIAWHKGQFPYASDGDRDNWPQVAIDGVTAYWIALDFTGEPLNSNDSAPTYAAPRTGERSRAGGALSGTVSMDAPNIRCFHLGEVNGIFPLGQKSEAQMLIKSDRSRRGKEVGSQLGMVINPAIETRVAGIVMDEGAGVIGEITRDPWSVSTPYPTSTNGAARRLEKDDQSYNWIPDYENSGVREYNGQHGPQQLHAEVAPLASPAPTTTSFAFTLAGSYDTEFEHCTIISTTAGGVATAEFNRIIKSTISGSTVTLTFAYAWSSTPTTAARFMIFAPGSFLTTLEPVESGSNSDVTKLWSEIHYNNEHDLTVDMTDPSSTLFDDIMDVEQTFLSDALVAFSIEKEPRFELSGYKHWGSTFDPVTRQLLISTGRYHLLSWDGRRLRRVRATFSDDDARIQQLYGLLRERPEESDDPDPSAQSFVLTDPPIGKFIKDFAGRLVISGISGDPNRVIYSAPGTANDIWPRVNAALIRDSENNPITGMATLDNELLVFTSTSMFASPVSDATGKLSFTPRGEGIGFINQESVQRIPIHGSSVLVGANADGVYMYTGAEPVAALDEWDRIIPEGVNKGAMERCVSAVSLYDNAYYLAVPIGSEAIPSRLLRWDYVQMTWYVYDCPFGGITSMAVDRDLTGREYVLFGHEDGFVSVLVPDEKDDSETITGYAITPPIQLSGSTMAATGYMLTMGDMGSTDTVDFRPILNQALASSRPAKSMTFNGSAGDLNSFVLGTSTLGGRGQKTRKVPAKSGSHCEQIQIKISGTKRWRFRYAEALVSPKGQRTK